ncbi:hypothetical protein H6F86_21395 [Phormidium sp. FACHB-592]|uniref:Uncharacterized protein n=1 Tax=Stenomitos frigidus AS-A4 TaxID=2933935 RepID=A0ABV0KHI3_9CYAN|nr:hypothetical protein [Phormidium sp. FACHB-592]MBD2076392.1 hypothetical protein [Phormidium sp. FACHB-592]
MSQDQPELSSSQPEPADGSERLDESEPLLGSESLDGSEQSEIPELSEATIDPQPDLQQTEPLVEPEQPTVLREDVARPVGRSRSTAARRTPTEKDEILPETLVRLLGEAVVATLPLLKQQSIKTLRGTIDLLETAVERLEAEPTPPQRKAPAPAISENVLPPSSKPNTGRLAPTLSTRALREKFQTVWQPLWRSWRSLLRPLRKRLPTSINRKFSDPALTATLAGLTAIVVWATGTLFDRPQPTVVSTPSTPSPVVAVSPSPIPTPIPSPTPIPPVVQAPEAPKPIEISPAPSKPSPPLPPLKLTPEQALIARIQDQVAAISNRYASGLVQSVQANFRGSRLIVNISDDWYGLSQAQQDKLASELLRRSQDLDFLKLEMVDGAGTLLARSPIVGAEMILFKRTNNATEAA